MAQRSYSHAVIEMRVGVRGNVVVAMPEVRSVGASQRRASRSNTGIDKLGPLLQWRKYNAERCVVAGARSADAVFVAFKMLRTTRLIAGTNDHRCGQARIMIAHELNGDPSVGLSTKNQP